MLAGGLSGSSKQRVAGSSPAGRAPTSHSPCGGTGLHPPPCVRADRDSLLLVALGVDSKEGSSLANAVLDWRDSDQVRRPNGAEVGDDAPLRPPSRPKDAPFDRVDELAMVLGMTPSIYHRAASHLTVAGDGRVNANSAPAPVLLTLPGMDAAAAAVVVSRRQKGPYRNVFELVASLPREAEERIQADMGTFTDRVAFGPREIEIVVTARAPGTPVGASLRARVELSGGSAWRVLQVNELSHDPETP